VWEGTDKQWNGPSYIYWWILLRVLPQSHCCVRQQHKASLNEHFIGVSCTFNTVTHQHRRNTCMKWGGERGESFHPSETRKRCFQRLGNRVKRPLRHFIAISPIPCGRSHAIVAIFLRATGSSHSHTPISPPLPSFLPRRRPLLRRP
jgi:hypothetical protein